MKMKFKKLDNSTKEPFIIVNLPCSCGCDYREIENHIGYITFSDGTDFAGLFFENPEEIKDMIKKLKELIK